MRKNSESLEKTLRNLSGKRAFLSICHALLLQTGPVHLVDIHSQHKWGEPAREIRLVNWCWADLHVTCSTHHHHQTHPLRWFCLKGLMPVCPASVLHLSFQSHPDPSIHLQAAGFLTFFFLVAPHNLRGNLPWRVMRSDLLEAKHLTSNCCSNKHFKRELRTTVKS